MRDARLGFVRRLFRLGLPCAVGAVLVAGGVVDIAQDRRFKGDPDLGGGLPKPTGPSSPSAPGPINPTPPLAVETAGLLVEALTRQPIPGALVLVTDSTGHPVGVDVTDATGGFTLYLAAKPGLELAIPSEGLAGIEISAGETLLIVVP